MRKRIPICQHGVSQVNTSIKDEICRLNTTLCFLFMRKFSGQANLIYWRKTRNFGTTKEQYIFCIFVCQVDNPGFHLFRNSLINICHSFNEHRNHIIKYLAFLMSYSKRKKWGWTKIFSSSFINYFITLKYPISFSYWKWCFVFQNLFWNYLR